MQNSWRTFEVGAVAPRLVWSLGARVRLVTTRISSVIGRFQHLYAVILHGVINDSVPWREQLLAVARSLEKRKVQRRWTDRTSFLVERDIMTSAYAVRKLDESRKVSDRLAARQWSVVEYKVIGRPPDLWGRFEPWEYYDLKAGASISRDMRQLCNQIIHSWVWMISATEGDDFDGIFVSSDRQRRKSLYFIHVDVLISIFREVGHEDIFEIELSRDDAGDIQYLSIKGCSTED